MHFLIPKLVLKLFILCLKYSNTAKNQLNLNQLVKLWVSLTTKNKVN